MVAARDGPLKKDLQQSFHLLPTMSEEVADAELNHNDAGEESPIPSATAPQDIIPPVSNTTHLAIPTRRIPPGQLLSGPPEAWVPYYIHTAKCDRCGQHNTSVIQRSSRSNKQFCKACMYLNVSDGLYSENVEGLDWTPQTVSVKGRARGTSKPRKPKQAKKPVVTLTPTRVSKRKRKEPKTPANKRIRPADQPESESRSENSLFVADDEASDEVEETADDVGFGQLPRGSLFSSEGHIHSRELIDVIETVERSEATDESGKRSRNGNGKDKEEPSERDSNDSDLFPWWEATQAPVSDAQGENVHFSLIEQLRSESSPEAVEAADILLMMAQDPRGFSSAAQVKELIRSVLKVPSCPDQSGLYHC